MEEIKKIYEEYGQLHEEFCELNYENGSFDGCTCAVKTMVEDLVKHLTEYFSHDIKFENEEQRKEAVKMYIEHLNGKI